MPFVGIFQSTRPSRGETRRINGGCGASDFNPLAPRGARPHAAAAAFTVFRISIHSPLAGRDIKRGGGNVGIDVFQSTRPSRGETDRRLTSTPIPTYFNPLAPRGARRCWSIPSGAIFQISIHSPLAGRDAFAFQSIGSSENFNPLAPRGARRKPPERSAAPSGFQSTRPSRGETAAHI